MLLSLAADLETTTCKAILERIKARAVAKYGDKWIAGLAREYSRIANENGDMKATPINRRPQIERAFEVGSCTTDTLIMLAASVGCRFQMICTVEEVEEL